jgi:NADPH:quinone reductase-like Zn-dependent oxidoreductase
VLVEVKAASINPFDLYFLAGNLQKMAPLPFPITLGGDFAGVVSQTSGQEFAVGDQVYGSALILAGGSGSFAEYCSANVTSIAHKPKTIDFQKAAGLPLVGSSAVQALEEHMRLQKGQKVLIHGGAGGIGSVAIQIAKALGAYVATTVSTNDIPFVTQLGADQAVDYKTQKFEEIIKDFDGVYDTVGGQTTEKSFLVLKKGGILVSMLGQPSEELAQKYNVTAIGQRTKTNTDHLYRLAQFVDNGSIKPQVDKVFPLDQTKEAYMYMQDSHRGKVVISIQ